MRIPGIRSQARWPPKSPDRASRKASKWRRVIRTRSIRHFVFPKRYEAGRGLILASKTRGMKSLMSQEILSTLARLSHYQTMIL